MTLATRLTILRLVLAPLCAWFLIQQEPRAFAFATAAFVLAAVTDNIDGYIARRTQTETELGRMLDPIADKLLVGLAYVGFFWIGVNSVKAWMVFAILGRELLVTGFRTYAGRRGVVIHSSPFAKWKTTLQMVVALVLLFMITWRAHVNAAPEYWRAPTSALANRALEVAVIATAVVTILSGLDYVWKNRSVFGGRRPGGGA
jgi:CDP-diacylglycerol--glycerol-3-phosphate 3-phosphatidyltransferase